MCPIKDRFSIINRSKALVIPIFDCTAGEESHSSLSLSRTKACRYLLSHLKQVVSAGENKILLAFPPL
jgi:hypothetical protein